MMKHDKGPALLLANLLRILERHRWIFAQQRVFWRSVALIFQ